MNIIIDEALESVVTLGVLRPAELSMPKDDGDALWQEVLSVCAELTGKYRGMTVGKVPKIAHARTLYRSIGIDPTKTRPSSEALLRRLLKGKPLYRIHPLVDLFNLVSLAALVPVGLYDESKIKSDTVTVRIGGPNEGYDGIRKDRVNVEGRLCIADDFGPFGSPTSDSLRTSIKGSVQNASAVFFQHASVPVEELEGALDMASQLATKYLDAEIKLRTILKK
jgi:DNA/RNA-binding domain of Phe-tRNA-synthetase-like protein